MEVQVFGVQKSADTRKALRFFSERRVKTHFVDLTIRTISAGELQRFIQRFRVAALIDRDGRRFNDLGLRHAQYSDAQWAQRLMDEPLLIRMPLVRAKHRLSVGLCEQDWKEWLSAEE